jgi:branched-chain amino acid transport system ATP-binding protein
VTAGTLEVRGLEASYGSSQVLFGVDLDIAPRECVTLLGRNGMGKSTTIHSILGILSPQRGSIRFGGQELAGKPPYVAARAGIGLVPEGRQVFANLTVFENLVATAKARSNAPERWTLASIYALFPRLKEREKNLAATLSGGEQQMLAIGRALMTNPDLLILDEATEGLAPIVRSEIWRCLKRLRDAGLSLLIVDKNIKPLLKLADRHFILEKGRIVWSGTSEALSQQQSLVARYLGV